jgi:bacterioferritin
MNKYQKSIDLLNKGVRMEVTASLQYMDFHVRLEDIGYRYLARIFKQVAIAEMKHTEEFAERILFLEGDFDMMPDQKVAKFNEKDVKSILKKGIELEQHTIDSYNEWARECGEAQDATSKRLFESLIAEEEDHLDTFRTELDNIETYGDNYLALQSIAESKNVSKKIGHPEE